MKVTKSAKFLALVLCAFNSMLNAQNLTISSTGETGTSGTNWSISGNTLTVSGTADINTSVIEGHLSNNSFSIQGNSTLFAVKITQTISSTSAGNGLTIGSLNNTGNISINNAISLAGPMVVFGGRVSIMDVFSLSGSYNLSITSSLFAILSSHAESYDCKAFLLSSKF